MKKSYVLFFILLSVSVFSQDKKNALLKFDTSDMETSILVHKSPVTDITLYNQQTNNNYDFFQAYKAISQGDLQQRVLPLQNLKDQHLQSFFSNVIPLAILHSDFESIKKEALQNNTITRDAEGYLSRTSNSPIFKKQQLTIAAPLRNTNKGLYTTFNLSASNVINTTNKPISNIAIDFDDGLGFRTIPLNQNININYSNPGKKIIQFRIILSDGVILYRGSTINISYSNEDVYNRFNRVITTFNANLPADLLLPYGETTSHLGTGEYEIFLSSDNILDKPIFLVDGFDPGDSRPIIGYTDSMTGTYVEGLYDLLNFNDNGVTSNLGNLVRAEGFDVIILNFPVYTRDIDATVVDGGVDFIERNAMLLVDLINTINTQKIGTAKNIIIGPSMGGLISRYALNYMEANPNMNHDTRLWISFDAPHHGANVPIGFQHQFNFLAFGLDDFWVLGDQNVEELQPIIDGMLKSSAARQMLTDQFEAHITNNDGVTFNSNLALPQEHPYKSILDSRINSFTSSGFPELTRNISIINGSGTNNRYPDNTTQANDLQPGSQIVSANIDLFDVAELKVNTFFTPVAGTQIETSQVHLDFPWWFPLANDRINNASSTAFSYSNGIDAASGGLFDIVKLTENLPTDGLVGEFLASLNTDYFNFIPSVSAMAFNITNNEINWFHSPSNVTTNRTTTNTTPFDAWYMPTDNEPHVTLTELNVDFALNEIFQETLSVDNYLQNSIRLEQNPVSEAITILSNSIFEDTQIHIIDITGKIVYNNTATLNARTHLPIQLASGLYILRLETTDNQIFNTKIVVK